MGYGELKLRLRSYDAQIHRAAVEDLERRCELVGPSQRVVLFTDTMGDPICRIRNSPMYKVLVAELDDELVGVIQGSIKRATVHRRTGNNMAKLGYVLGLRIAHLHRRKGIGLKLVRELEEWFIANDVDYAYMATEKDNEASVNLFVHKLSYVKYRTPAILVRPVNFRSLRISSNIEMAKLEIEDAESLYRRFMTSAEFFPDDIGNILRNKLSLGTWVAYCRGQPWKDLSSEGRFPTSWAMLSVWNSGEVFKVRLETAPALPCLIYANISRFIDKVLPCFQLPAVADFLQPFGFYFIYGVYHEGPMSGKLVRALCQQMHNMATKTRDCKVIVTEVGGTDHTLRLHIPHWNSLSCPEDLWCIKSLKNEEDTLHDLHKTPTPTATLFVDPREV